MTAPTSTSEEPRVFPNTRWSLVLAATTPDAPESAAALESLCRAYWQPLYAYVRRRGHSPCDAQDLTQEFFYRLLEKRWLDAADREKGKLRSFLITALKNFMNKEWRRASAQRRGGGRFQVPFDTELAETHYAAESSSQLAPDQVFDREWALTLLELTMNRLRSEFCAAGKSGGFETLKGCLVAAHGEIEYATIASRLGLSEGAARVAVHRLRKRFRDVYQEEISRTLADGEDFNGELRHLASALAAK